MAGKRDGRLGVRNGSFRILAGRHWSKYMTCIVLKPMGILL